MHSRIPRIGQQALAEKPYVFESHQLSEGSSVLGDGDDKNNISPSNKRRGAQVVPNASTELDLNTDQYKVDMKKGNANILVAVRCRPLSIKEKQKQSQKSVKILDEKIVII